MEDTDMLPCPSCRMRGPVSETEEGARQTYMVVAKLVDDVLNLLFGPHAADFDLTSETSKFAIQFVQARHDHAPY
jgi:hypothetical protein